MNWNEIVSELEDIEKGLRSTNLLRSRQLGSIISSIRTMVPGNGHPFDHTSHVSTSVNFSDKELLDKLKVVRTHVNEIYSSSFGGIRQGLGYDLNLIQVVEEELQKRMANVTNDEEYEIKFNDEADAEYFAKNAAALNKDAEGWGNSPNPPLTKEEMQEAMAELLSSGGVIDPNNKRLVVVLKKMLLRNLQEV